MRLLRQSQALQDFSDGASILNFAGISWGRFEHLGNWYLPQLTTLRVCRYLSDWSLFTNTRVNLAIYA